jgi:hypothetical protein
MYAKKLISFCFILASITSMAADGTARQQVFELKVYHFKDSTQEKTIDSYLQNAFVPALHRAGISKVGVFKTIGNDTLTDKTLYILISFQSLEQFHKLGSVLAKDKIYLSAGSTFINASYEHPAFIRIESILLNAFPMSPRLELPSLQSPFNERVYELRSYESASEKNHHNKVAMFNEGGEIDLFKRLGFNAIFYGSVMSGAHMPNLMYLTSFENKTERDAHWKAFGSDPAWKKLSAMPEYQHNVSHIDIIFLRPTSYSDF